MVNRKYLTELKNIVFFSIVPTILRFSNCKIGVLINFKSFERKFLSVCSGLFQPRFRLLLLSGYDQPGINQVVTKVQ